MNPKYKVIPDNGLSQHQNEILKQQQSNVKALLDYEQKLKKEDPKEYNRLQKEKIRLLSPSSEIVYYEDADGKLAYGLGNNPGMSGTDPIARDVVLGIALNKPTQYLIRKTKSFLNPNTYTEDLIKLLGDKKTSNGQMFKNRTFRVQEFEKYLKKLGVDVSKFSDVDLVNLMEIRNKSMTFPKGRFVMVDNEVGKGQNIYTLYDNGISIGELLTQAKKGKQYVLSVKSYSPTHKHVSRDLYDAALTKGNQINQKGLVSGDVLFSPEQTKHIWNKYYPKRRVVSRSGRHYYNNGENVIRSGNPYPDIRGEVVNLVEPYSNIPIKSSGIFHPDMIDRNTWTLKAPDWNDKNIFKIGIPGLFGITAINE